MQTSQEIGLGSAIQPTSQRRGDQYEVDIQINMVKYMNLSLSLSLSLSQLYRYKYIHIFRRIVQ